MQQLLSEIKEWKHGWKQYLVYSWKLTIWLYIARGRKTKILFSKYFDLLLRICFILMAFLTGAFLYFYGSFSFTQEILSGYLVSIGAMAGGVIAIVFTISIFLLQNAANLYSSQYLEVYIHDWKEKIVYLCVVLITIAFFGTGLYIGGLPVLSEEINSIIVWASLTLIGLIFALIDWQYKTVRKKISPTETIVFLEKKGIGFIEELENNATRTAGIISARDPNLSKDEALAKTFNTFFQPAISNLNRQIENLVEISLRLSENQEVETVKRGFTAVHNLLFRYLDTRKTSTITMPSEIALLATETDSQRFLFNNFERLNKAAEKFVDEGKDELATYFIWIYESLAKKSSEMKFVGSIHSENPVFDLIAGSFNNYIDVGVRAKNLEVTFQSVDKLGTMASICAQEGYPASLGGIEDKLFDVAFQGILVKRAIITDQCNINYLRLLYSIFVSNKIVRNLQIRSILNHIADISYYLFLSTQKGHMAGGIATSFSLSKAYDNLYQYLIHIYNLYGTIKDKREKSRFKSDFLELIKVTTMSFRRLSEKIEHCDNTVTESIGRLLQNINDLLFGLLEVNDFDDEKVEIRNRLGWNIHLPYWFTHHAKSFDASSNQLRSLIESTARAGVRAYEIGDKKLLRDAINCIASITDQALEKSNDKYGFDEPRLMERLCYLGILALKNNWMDVFVEAQLKIFLFEPKYRQKYFSNVPAHIDTEKLNPNPNQLFDEVFRWRDKFDYNRLNRMRGMMDNAEDMMYQLITVEDIDRFTFRVWQKWDASSSINDELEAEAEKLELKRERIKLLKTLNKIAEK